MLTPHYALAYTPPPASPLARFGAGVLGYDCFEAADVPQRAVAGIDPAILSLLTVEPRRHGFGARFVPPFCFGEEREAELTDAVESLARRHYPILVGRLEIEHRDEFVVLRAQHHAPLEAFARACRGEFASFPKAAPTADSDASTKRESLDLPNGFYFHMALAGPVPAVAAADLARHFTRAFEKLARDEVEVGSISLLRQDDPAARFRVLMSTRLTGH